MKKKKKSRDFTDGPVVKNLPANVEDTGSTPGLGKPTGLRAAKPLYHTPELTSCNYCSLRTPEPVLHREAHALQLEDSPCSLELKKNTCSKEDSAQQKNEILKGKSPAALSGCDSISQVPSPKKPKKTSLCGRILRLSFKSKFSYSNNKLCFLLKMTLLVQPPLFSLKIQYSKYITVTKNPTVVTSQINHVHI